MERPSESEHAVGRAGDLVTARLGQVTLDPAGPVEAGSMGQWTITLTVGSYGIDEGGTIKLSQRFAADWEIPQFDRPQASGYTTVTTSGEARLRAYYHTKAHERPWMKCMVIDVYDGSLAPGDVVTIVLGDRSQGGPGIRAQTFQEAAHEFRVLVDPTNASRAVPLPTSPRFPVIPGPPVNLVCIVPSEGQVDTPVAVFVKGEDHWGNPTPPPADVSLAWIPLDAGEGPDAVAFSRGALVARAPTRGRVHVEASTAQGPLVAHSNPIRIAAELPELRHWWGDLHAQSAGTVGTGDEDAYFTFGRDAARLDFASHQGNDFQIDDDYWAHLNATVGKYHKDGEFVVFPGYEWSANTPAGGDRNVFFRREGLPILRSSHWQIPHVPEDALSPAHPADVLFARLREHVARDDVLMGAHVGGRYADIRRYLDAELGPLVEVLSCWGIFEWLLWDAFEGGHVVGIMCNSDGHKGRPGAEGPGAGEFGMRGGLTCVQAAAQTRDSIWQGLQARHCYGTSGARMLADFSAQTPDNRQFLLGDVIPDSVSHVHLRGEVVGCEPLESLVLYAGRMPIRTIQPGAFRAGGTSRRVRIMWHGSRIRGRGRRVTWDGALTVQGALITHFAPVAFDSFSDGVERVGPNMLAVRSATTGDMDGLDLWLDTATHGELVFDSAAGKVEVDLATLAHVGDSRSIGMGGLDMGVVVTRYPERVGTSAADGADELVLRLDETVEPPRGVRTPYWIKATQVDGQMAWVSPIYVAGA